MDSKRKLIYGTIIVVCLVASAAILLWGRGSSVPAPDLTTDLTLPAADDTAAAPATSAIHPGPDGSYPAPAVFPKNTKLDTSLFDSGQFRLLNDYDTVTLGQGELGRDDPFAKY